MINIDALIENADWPKRTPDKMSDLLLFEARGLGGPGSGNFGHAGRPGEVGGSAPGGWAEGTVSRDWPGKAEGKRYWQTKEYQQLSPKEKAAYDESPQARRDDLESRANEPAYALREEITVWHGTSSAAVDAIKKEGLKPLAGPGNDSWALNNGLSDSVNYEIAGRKASVYVAFTRNEATAYAKRAAEVTRGHPVILEIRLPVGIETKKDELDPNRSTRLREVKPEWITSIRMQKSGKWRALEKTETLYGVLFADEDDRILARRERPLHAIADSYHARVKNAVEHAFAAGRRAVDRQRLQGAKGIRDVQAAMRGVPDAVKAALEDVLPGVLSKLFVEAGKGTLKTLGGPGSGNFGHAGRPGEVGGSAAIVFHGTTLAAVESIKKHGLDSGKAGNVYRQSKKGNVYVATSENEAMFWARQAAVKLAPESGDLDVALIEIQVPASIANEQLKRDKNLSFVTGAKRFEGSIPPEWIKSIRVGRIGRHEMLHPDKLKQLESGDEYVTRYIAILFEKDDELETLASGDDLVIRKSADVSKRAKLPKLFDPSYAQDWAEKHAAKLAKGLSDTTRDAIAEAIANAFEERDKGKAWKDLVDEILDAVGDDARAQTIAETEVMAAANAGQRAAWNEQVESGFLGSDEKRRWLTFPDACPECDEYDGEEVGLDELYHDSVEGPPLHPRCRCIEELKS
ncbi:MAG TPA: phage minor head protein [Sphingomicrobium sp.]|nr:phage minor head protein [Sphingomicrobium sp.]